MNYCSSQPIAIFREFIYVSSWFNCECRIFLFAFVKRAMRKIPIESRNDFTRMEPSSWTKNQPQGIHHRTKGIEVNWSREISRELTANEEICKRTDRANFKQQMKESPNTYLFVNANISAASHLYLCHRGMVTFVQ